MRRARALAISASGIAVALIAARFDVAPAGAAGLTLEVTSTADSSPAGGPACPDATRCTLRRAIEVVNANASAEPYTITFSQTSFSKANPGVIVVGNTALPSITRAHVAVDGSSAGVQIVSGNASLTSAQNGVVSTGGDATIRGLAISGFPAACLVATGQGSLIGGDRSAGQGNTIGGCATGIAIRGANSTVLGNDVGFSPAGEPAPVDAGIAVAASNVLVGHESGGVEFANRVGNAGTAIFVGDDVAPAFVLVRIARNIVGRNPAGGAAPVATAIWLSQPSTGTGVIANAVANAETGIAVNADANGIAVIQNRLESNTFESISGLAIDLGKDGLRNPNDQGDLDGGPNGLLNAPSITRAVQSKLTGTAGASCGGCTVQLYVASHSPGSGTDYGTTPLAGGTITAAADGSFSLDNPPVTPGQWLTGLAIDAAGNTSEFGDSTRVGAGAVQCGNTTLTTGWNHVGFFGSAPVSLSQFFPADPSGHVTAIYHLLDGTTSFERWLGGTPAAQTLFAVAPGESYWMYADAPVSLAGGFSLSFPLPVDLKPGWNDFVYIGGSADVRDALASLGGRYTDLYRFVSDPSGGHWAIIGNDDTPRWARELGEIEACATYQIFVDLPQTLTPLQP